MLVGKGCASGTVAVHGNRSSQGAYMAWGCGIYERGKYGTGAVTLCIGASARLAAGSSRRQRRILRAVTDGGG